MKQLRDGIASKFLTTANEAPTASEESGEVEIAPLTMHEERKLTECEPYSQDRVGNIF
jgi:hypothetical protein